MSTSKPSEPSDHYDLDLEAHHQTDAEAAIRDAVKATAGRAGDPAALDSEVEVVEVDLAGADPDQGGEDEESLVARLEEEISELRERSVRTLADFENYRRRVERDRVEHRRYAAAEALVDFLSVMDNLQRALQAKGSEADLRVGVEMIHRQMIDLLQRLGAKQIAALDQPFDPLQHEAVSRVERPDVDRPTVTAELQAGYKLHDRLLRPAMVEVAVPVEPVGEAALRVDASKGDIES
jgi:molecular chaperone GrpE